MIIAKEISKESTEKSFNRAIEKKNLEIFKGFLTKYLIIFQIHSQKKRIVDEVSKKYEANSKRIAKDTHFQKRIKNAAEISTLKNSRRNLNYNRNSRRITNVFFNP